MFYLYECNNEDCGLKEDVQHGMNDSPVITCKKCGSTMRRLITGGVGFRMNKVHNP